MFRPLYRFVAVTLVVAALLTALLMRVSFLRPTAADGPAAPSISATPGTPQSGGAAAVGTSVTVTGTGFGAGETLTLSLNSQSLTTTPSPLVAASDGSFSGTFVVPSLTVRAYPLVAVGQSSGTSASLIFWLQAASENVYSPLSGQATYQVSDSDPREPSMQYLRITNTGDANLVNPKILPDSLPVQDPFVDTSSVQSIVNSVLAANPNATTDAQKAFVLWQWVVHSLYHFYDAQNPDPQNQLDSTAILNNYGYTRCWNQSRLMADLFQAAGYQTRTWNLTTHAVPEVFYGGAWHEYDTDQRKVYFAPDGTTVLGTQDLVSNPHAIFLDTTPGGKTKYYGYFRYTAPYTANLYVTTGDNKPLGNIYPPVAHDLGITLRKNETLMEYWSNIGKYHDNYLHSGPPPVYTNGDLVYVPDLSQASYANGVSSQTNVSSSSQDGLQPNLHAQSVGSTSSVVYLVKSPYTLVGSLLSAQTYRATSNDSLSISLSLDGTHWGSPVYTQSKLGYDNPTLNLSTSLNNGTLPEEYQYYVMFQWTATSAANGAGLASFNLDSQFEQAWEAIAPLHSGTTTLTYTDQTGTTYTPGTVQVAYGWTPQPAASNLSGSSLVPDYTSTAANGNSFVDVKLTLKTSSGTLVPNMLVQLIPTAGIPVQITRAYLYQGLRGQTDSSGQAIFEVRSQQVGSVTLMAADKNGASLGLKPVTLTFTAPPAVTLTTSEGSAVVNGGFETGDLTGWTAGGSVTPTVESSTVHSGTDAAQLGATSGSATATNSWLVETLSIPTTAKSLNLAYLLSNPSGSSSNYLEVWVQDTAGDQVFKLSSTSANSSGWQTLSLTNLKLYGGNTIQIYINVHQGGGTSNPAYAYLDDVQIA